MKRLIAVLATLFAVMFLMQGCDAGQTVSSDKKIVVQNSDGKVEITTVNEGNGGWCPEGGNWNYVGTAQGQAANAEWKVDKLMAFGEYAGLCHVIYTVTNEGKKMVIDYYFSQDGKSGFFLMDVDGQKIKQSITPTG